MLLWLSLLPSVLWRIELEGKAVEMTSGLPMFPKAIGNKALVYPLRGEVEGVVFLLSELFLCFS